jgi:hypothetical protein
MKKMKLYIERYGETKFYGLYDVEKINEVPWGGLVAVFVYKQGAKNVKRILEGLERELEKLRKEED